MPEPSKVPSRPCLWSARWMTPIVAAAAAAAMGAAQAQGLPAPAHAVITKAQQDLQDSLARRHKARTDKADHCRRAEEAEAALSRVPLTGGAEVKNRSEQAERAAAECEAAEELLASRDHEVKVAAQNLRQLTRDAASCGAEPASCAAMREADLERRRAAVSPSRAGDAATVAKPAEATPAKSHSDVVATLIKDAAAAQESVSKMRGKLATPYKPGDDAMSTTLGLSDSEDLSHKADPGGARRRLLAQEATAAYNESARVKRNLYRAQSASNDLVLAARDLMLCVNKDGCKDSPDVGIAQDAKKRLDSALNAAQDSYALAQTIARKAQASQALNFNEQLVARSVEFQRMLDQYPDAKSLLGSKSSYLITASKSASSASIKLGNDKLLPVGFGSFNVVFEAPLNKSGDTTLFTAGEEFTNNASIKASWYRLEGRDSEPSTVLNLLWANGLSLKWESKPYSFLSPVDLTTKTSGRREHWELSAFTALFPLSDESNVHQLRFGLRREAEAAPALTRCPVSVAQPDSSLKCVTAAFEPPGRLQTVRTLSYEYRLTQARFAISPRLTLTDGGKTEKEFHLPIYLVRDSEKDTQFNAGISLNWNSARPNDRWQLGVFVGAPFSLFQLDR